MEQISSLVRGEPITEGSPWSEGPKKVEHFYQRLCADLQRNLQLKSRIEWNHYGSGYASFIDAWFYREE